jgi:hypothetical protein
MTSREVVSRLCAITFVVGAVVLIAVVTGRSSGLVLPASLLAWWLSLLLVIRPYVYERFGRRAGDWIVVILIAGPFAILAAPVLWWEHRNLEPGT